MKTLLIPLLLSLAASSALAHGDHDDETFIPLRPGATMQTPAPTAAAADQAQKAAEQNAAKLKVEKKAKAKAAKKTADAAQAPADQAAAPAPTP